MTSGQPQAPRPQANPFGRVLPDLVEATLETPVVDLDRAFGDLDGRVFAKLEVLAPGGSSELRVARSVLEDARKAGLLGAHQTVLVGDQRAEGFARAGAVLGFPVLAVVPPGTDPTWRRHLEAFGAEVEVAVDVSAHLASLARVTGGLVVSEDQAEAAFRAHRMGTAVEALRQTRGEVDAFCAHVRTGQTFAGCAAAFHEFEASIRGYTVQLTSGPPDLPATIDPERVAHALRVDPEAARAAAERVARREGLLVGSEAGAVLAAARQLLEGPLPGCTVLVVLDGDDPSRPAVRAPRMTQPSAPPTAGSSGSLFGPNPLDDEAA